MPNRSKSMSSSSSSSTGAAAAASAGADEAAAAAGAADAKADGSARKSFSFWISGNVKSISAQSAARFLSEFDTMCGSDASVGMPASRLSAAMFCIAPKNLPTTISSVMSRTAASKTEPLYVHGDNLHPVLERLDAHLREQHRLRRRDLLARLAHLLRRGQLNRTLDNLRGDVERLEEVRLRRVQTRRPGRQHHINRGDHASLRTGRHLVRRHDLADLVHVTVAEDKPDVPVDRREQLVEAELLVHGHVVAQARADHRVLAHQDRRLATELHADLLHLLRADEVDTDDQGLRAALQELDQLGEVRGLLGLDHHTQELVGKDSSPAANR